ncbi:MAG: DUF1232 domain-containing protein [Candidatus Omnitrophota bacterium]
MNSRNPFLFSRFMETIGHFSPAAILTFIYHLPNFIRLFSRLLNDPRVPLHLKLFCYFAIAYFFLPFDLIKDFPSLLFGRVDDVVLLIWSFRKLVMDTPPEIVQEHVDALSARRPRA